MWTVTVTYMSILYILWCPRDWDVDRRQSYKSGLPSSRDLRPCCRSAVC